MKRLMAMALLMIIPAVAASAADVYKPQPPERIAQIKRDMQQAISLPGSTVACLKFSDMNSLHEGFKAGTVTTAVFSHYLDNRNCVDLPAGGKFLILRELKYSGLSQILYYFPDGSDVIELYTPTRLLNK